MKIKCTEEQRLNLFKELWKGKEIRPFNKQGDKDGNFNYVHQEHIAYVILQFLDIEKEN